jgi:hypothetical protein
MVAAFEHEIDKAYATTVFECGNEAIPPLGKGLLVRVMMIGKVGQTAGVSYGDEPPITEAR